mmetsp:Transcript_11079/g.28820  ORF Transcript_11079/g.28820 Transcript_11079/m.28820 type:complete len:502 (+) Transcript_11079:65-1570(+)
MSAGGQPPEAMSDDDDVGFQNDFKDSRLKGRDDDFDDDDEFSASTANAGNPAQPGGLNDSQVVANRPYDEAVELDDDEDSKDFGAGGAASAAGPRPPGRDAARSGSGGDSGLGGGLGGGGGESQGAERDAEGVVKNQPFDEAMVLSDEDSVDDDKEQPRGHSGGGQGFEQRASLGGRGDAPPATGQHDDDAAEYGDEEEPNFGRSGGLGSVGGRGSLGGGRGGGDDDDDDDDDNVGPHREVTAGDGAAAELPSQAAGMYNPADFENLNVTSEIKELFQYIGRYKPHNIELETKMKPFIPDYIPAVGEIDPFVKVPRPDGKPDSLGLTVLDEPSSSQSDPVVMQLQLRAITKASSHQPVLVRSIEAAEKDPKAIQSWIDSIKELHRNKPQPTVTYSKPMPDVEELMQIWPAEFEEMLDEVKLPTADIDMPLAEYAKLVCAMLDIPVHTTVMEPLHLLFTLFSDFKANVHFQQQFTDPTELHGVGGRPDQPVVEGGAQSLSFE